MERSHPTVQALAWAITAGLLFTLLNALMRQLALELHPYQTQFLRYLFGLIVMLPLVLRVGRKAFLPKSMAGHFVRGALHTLGLCMWFTAIVHISLADTTAIGFTGPIFIMLGAAWFFGETMRWDRWLAALVGFTGVLVVLAPKLSGSGGGYALLMLASSPVFAASFLVTKALTRQETPAVIVVWQAITISLLSLPLALPSWNSPTSGQWCLFAVCGVLGSSGHYCLTRSFTVADISATQSVKFLELVWAAILGWLIFADLPSEATLLGGAIICASTIWIARRETRRPPDEQAPP